MSKAMFALVLSTVFSIIANIKPASAQQQRVTCRPIDEQGNNLPYSAGDYTLRCEMFMLWRTDCETSDPLKIYYRLYCLNLVRTRP
jgi:hypothetical protein